MPEALAVRDDFHRIPVARHHGLVFTERIEFGDPLARFLDDQLCIGKRFNSFVVQLIIREISLMSQIVETQGDFLEFFRCERLTESGIPNRGIRVALLANEFPPRPVARQLRGTEHSMRLTADRIAAGSVGLAAKRNPAMSQN